MAWSIFSRHVAAGGSTLSESPPYKVLRGTVGLQPIKQERIALSYSIDPIAPIPKFVPVIGYPEDVPLLLLALRLACERPARYRTRQA
ncbi:protein of unknown function [Methylocaldum szegediense]|uniref:Uncharacterized protein n=1 Tax=Methylocaldum szegediense TaxID=73780 RepID=A0ABM9HZK1_9GAMM|nr:protein of unknown function [Methylocaldum szegediense]